MNEVENVLQPRKAVKRYRYKKLAGIILQFVTLHIFWLVLSGRYEIGYLALGVLAAAFITFLNHELLSFLWHTDKKGETQTRIVSVPERRPGGHGNGTDCTTSLARLAGVCRGRLNRAPARYRRH